MKRKAYMKPAVQVVKIQHQCHILAGSEHDNYGMNNTLIDDEEDVATVAW